MLLTRLGGGAFGNEDTWIDTAMLRALRLAQHHDLDVTVVSYRPAASGLPALIDRHRFKATGLTGAA